MYGEEGSGVGFFGGASVDGNIEGGYVEGVEILSAEHDGGDVFDGHVEEAVDFTLGGDSGDFSGEALGAPEVAFGVCGAAIGRARDA